MDLGLTGKRALVLGASQGLGFAVAQTLAAEGVRVAICSRSAEKLEKASRAIPGSTTVVADLSKPEAGTKAAEQAISSLGGIDILVTNTGGPPAGRFDAVTNDQWQQGYQSLWLSVVDSVRACLPGMRSQAWGRILLVTSVAAKEPIPNLMISNGLRAGLLGFMKTLASEVAREGITVNALLPGYTMTDRLRQLGVSDALLGSIPMGRAGRPDEFAAAAAFLASEKASYITGQAIAIDGGLQKGH